MRKNLLEQIQKLISEAADQALASMGNDFGKGGFGGHRFQKKQEMSEADIRKERSRLARRRMMEKLNKITKRRTGKGGNQTTYIFSYKGNDDTRNWQPLLVSLKDTEIKINGVDEAHFLVTPQTRNFLLNLLTNLRDTVIDKNDPEKRVPKIADIKITASIIPDDIDHDYENVLKSLSIKETEGISSLISLIKNDERFHPQNYILNVEVPIKEYKDEDLDAISKEFSFTDTSISDIGSIKTSINQSKVNIELKVIRDFTLMPMYNEIRNDFVPRQSKVGAIEKLAWAFQKAREMNKNMIPLSAKIADRRINQINDALKSFKNKNSTDPEIAAKIADLNKEKTEMVNMKAALQSNTQTYIDQTNINETTNSDVMSVGPLALLERAKRLQDNKDKNSVIVITSDMDVSYIYLPEIKNSTGDIIRNEKIMKFNGQGAAGKNIKDWFEGLIPKELFDANIASLDLPDNAKTEVQDFINEFVNRKYDFVYCLKMMFADQIGVSYSMDLPQSVFDKIGGDKVIAMPENVKVPGSQNLANTRTTLKTSKTASSKLITTTDDVLSIGSGSLTFLKDAYKMIDADGIGKKRLIDSFTDLGFISDMLKSSIYDYFFELDESSYNKLKNGETIDVNGYQTSLNTNQYLADTLETVKSFPKNGKLLLLKHDKLGYFTAEENFERVRNLISQMVGQIDKDVWFEVPGGQELYKDISTSFNTTLAGRPGTVKKIQNDMITAIEDANNFKKSVSDALLEHNLTADLGSMIKAFFVAYEAIDDQKDQKVAHNNKKVISIKEPRLFRSRSLDGLNISGTRKGKKKEEVRGELNDRLITFLHDDDQKLLKSAFGAVSTNTNPALAISNVLRDFYDIMKTLEKLTAIDGARVVEFGDLADVETLARGTLSEVDSSLDPTKFSTADVSPSVESGIKTAFETATASDIKSGIVVDAFCRDGLKPIVRIIKNSIKQSTNERRPIGITSADSQVPYTPVHTLVFATRNGNGGLTVSIISSIVKIPNFDSPYSYTYDIEHQNFSVSGDIQPQDKEAIRNELSKMDYAYCMFNMMSSKRLMSECAEALNQLSMKVGKDFDSIKDIIEKKNLFRYDDDTFIKTNNAEYEDELNDLLNTTSVNGEAETNGSVKNMIADIVRYIEIIYTAKKLMNNN